MELEQKRIELENEIADIQSEIEIKVAELDEVRELLSKESFEEAHEDELDDEDFEDEGDEEEDLDDETEEEDFEDEEDEEEDEDEVGTEEELKARESELMEEVLVLQMKLTALNKQLNDILAQQGMNNLGESDE